MGVQIIFAIHYFVKHFLKCNLHWEWIWLPFKFTQLLVNIDSGQVKFPNHRVQDCFKCVSMSIASQEQMNFHNVLVFFNLIIIIIVFVEVRRNIFQRPHLFFALITNYPKSCKTLGGGA